MVSSMSVCGGHLFIFYIVLQYALYFVIIMQHKKKKIYIYFLRPLKVMFWSQDWVLLLEEVNVQEIVGCLLLASYRAAFKLVFPNNYEK